MFGKKQAKPQFKPGGVAKADAPAVPFKNRFGDSAEPSPKFRHGGTVHMTRSSSGVCRGTGCAVKGKSTKGCV